MGILRKDQLGNVDFFGEAAIAFREIHITGEWKFVLVVNNQRIVLITY